MLVPPKLGLRVPLGCMALELLLLESILRLLRGGCGEIAT